jgi:hypothetical protein
MLNLNNIIIQHRNVEVAMVLQHVAMRLGEEVVIFQFKKEAESFLHKIYVGRRLSF